MNWSWTMAPGEQELTPDQIILVAEHLQAKVTEGCPMCRSAEWDIIAGTAAIVLTPTGTASSRGFFTVVAVCRQCAFVAHFAAKPMGLFAGEAEQ